MDFIWESRSIPIPMIIFYPQSFVQAISKTSITATVLVYPRWQGGGYLVPDEVISDWKLFARAELLFEDDNTVLDSFTFPLELTGETPYWKSSFHFSVPRAGSHRVRMELLAGSSRSPQSFSEELIFVPPTVILSSDSWKLCRAGADTSQCSGHYQCPKFPSVRKVEHGSPSLLKSKAISR